MRCMHRACISGLLMALPRDYVEVLAFFFCCCHLLFRFTVLFGRWMLAARHFRRCLPVVVPLQKFKHLLWWFYQSRILDVAVYRALHRVVQKFCLTEATYRSKLPFVFSK
jgi:hypothetical protein